MKPLPGRLPTAADVALAIIWPTLLIALLIALGMFDALLLGAMIWADEHIAAELLATGATVSAAFAFLPGTIFLLCYTGEALAARGPTRRATWLRRAAGITRTTSALVRLAFVGGLVLIGLLIFMLSSGLELVAGLAAALLAAPVIMIALRMMQRRMRITAARARRHARRLCPNCHYEITGLTQCPECGAPVRRSRV